MKAMSNEGLLLAVNEALEKGMPVAMASVVTRTGSAPQTVGAKMAVFKDGTIAGTVGGGCAEAEVMRIALTVLDTGIPVLHTIELTADAAEEEGMVCGGRMEVFIEPVAEIATGFRGAGTAGVTEGGLEP